LPEGDYSTAGVKRKTTWVKHSEKKQRGRGGGGKTWIAPML